MSKTIYISRKCEHCHELLILLHKNRDILKFPVVDVHTKPYPKIVTSVPCMVVDDKLLPGEELFKFLNYLIEQNSNSPDDVKNIMNGMRTNIENEKENTMLPQTQNVEPQNDDDLLPGFCIGGVCELGFSSIENDKDISMDNSFEMLDSSGDITPEMDMGHTKNEKAQQMDDDYSRMMQERGNDLGMKSN